MSGLNTCPAPGQALARPASAGARPSAASWKPGPEPSGPRHFSQLRELLLQVHHLTDAPLRRRRSPPSISGTEASQGRLRGAGRSRACGPPELSSSTPVWLPLRSSSLSSSSPFISVAESPRFHPSAWRLDGHLGAGRSSEPSPPPVPSPKSGHLGSQIKPRCGWGQAGGNGLTRWPRTCRGGAGTNGTIYTSPRNLGHRNAHPLGHCW